MKHQILVKGKTMFLDDHVINFAEDREALRFVPILMRGLMLDEADRGQHVRYVSDVKVVFFNIPIIFDTVDDAEAAADLFVGRQSKNSADLPDDEYFGSVTVDELLQKIEEQLKTVMGLNEARPDWQLTSENCLEHLPSGETFDFGSDEKNRIFMDMLLKGSWPRIVAHEQGGFVIQFDENPEASVKVSGVNMQDILRFGRQFKIKQPFSFTLVKRIDVEAGSFEEAKAKAQAENPGFTIR